jgi:hypothetical protein
MSKEKRWRKINGTVIVERKKEEAMKRRRERELGKKRVLCDGGEDKSIIMSKGREM